MIPKRFRGIPHREIASLLASGHKAAFFAGTIRWRPRLKGACGSRIAILVPRRVVPKAVDRNRIRRKLQSDTLSLLSALNPPMDVLVLWKRHRSSPSRDKLVSELQSIFKKRHSPL